MTRSHREHTDAAHALVLLRARRERGVIRGPNVMVLNPSVQAKTVPDFIARAKANPRKVNMASSGNGSTPHVAGAIEYIRAGKLRALAVTTATRSETLPDIPTVGEFVPGYEASNWNGVGAPKGTPAEIIDKLNKEINAGLADPKIKARLADLDGTVLPGSPADFGKLIAEETEKWGNVIRALNIKAE